MRPSLKKWLKVAAWLAGAGSVGLAAALATLTRPGVQRGLALEGLRRAGWSGDIREITVSYTGRLEMAGVALKDPVGRAVACERVTGKVGWGGFVFGFPHIHRLEAHGVFLDFASPRVAASPEEAARVTVSPGRWRIDNAVFHGRVMAPGCAWNGVVRLEDCAFAKGGRVVFDLAAEGGHAPRVVGEARVALSGVVSGGDWRGVWRALKPVVDAEFRAYPASGGAFAAVCRLKADADVVDLLAEAGGGRVSLDVALPAAGPVTAQGRWALSREAFVPWVSDGVPTGDSRGELTVAFDPATFAGNATVAMSASATVVPGGYRGPRRLEAEARLTRSATGAVTADRLALTLGGESPTPAVSVRVSGLVRESSGRLSASGDQVSAEVAASALPMDWVAGLLDIAPWRMDGGLLDGRLRVHRRVSGALVLETDAVPTLRADRIARDGIAASVVTLRVPLRAVLEPGGAWTAGVADAVLSLDGTEAARVSLERSAAPDGVRWLLSGRADAALARLSGLPPAVARLAGTGASVEARAVLGGPSGAITESADLTVRAGGAPVLTARRVPASGGEPGGWRVRFRDTPLAPVPDLAAGRRFSGVIESGELLVAADLHSGAVPLGAEPIRLRDFGWSDAAGVVRMAPSAVTATGGWSVRAGEWRMAPVDFRIGAPDAVALEGRLAVRGGAAGVAGEAYLIAEPARLRSVFPTAGLPPFDSGRVHLDARLGETGELSATVSVRDARVAGVDKPLGAHAALEVTRRGGVRAVYAPVRIEGPSGVSEAVLDATAMREGAGWRWRGELRYGDLRPADLLLFRPAGGGVGVDLPEAAPAATPFWRGHTGELRVRAASNRPAVAGAPGALLTWDDSAVRLEMPATAVGGGTVSAGAALRFTPGAKPYALDGALRFDGVAADPFFTAIAPRAGGWVTGDFSGVLTVSGASAAPSGLRSASTWRLTAESGAGILRIFRADNEAMRITGDLVEVAGALAGDLGTLLGKRDKRAAGMADAVAVLKDTLAAVHYRRCALVVAADSAGALEVPSFTLLSETLRLRGRARLSASVGAGFFSREAMGELRVEARGEPGLALFALGRTESGQDAEGWWRGPVLRYDGPLDNLRNNLLNNLFRAISERSDPQENGAAAR